MADTEPLIYTPAKRGNVGVLIMLAGPSGSGKTKSALRLAVGLANGGPIGFCDTEHGRALYYADEFEFLHLSLKEPFTPKRFEEAAVVSQKAGHAVWICDSFTHEHAGPGGVLDMQEAELQRMTKGDFSKRDNLKYTSWIAPKMEHKHLLQRLWQLNAHIILCCHAAKKLDLIKDPRTGKTVPNPDAGLVPICGDDIPYAMTASFMLDPKQPGIPTWLKHLDKLDGMVALDRPIDEDTGRRIGAWARGEKPAPVATGQSVASTTTSKPVAKQEAPVDSNPDEDEGPDDTAIISFAERLAALFLGAADRRAYFKLVDDNVANIEFMKKNRKAIFQRELEPSMKACFVRTEPPPPDKTPTDATATAPVEGKPLVDAAGEEIPF